MDAISAKFIAPARANGTAKHDPVLEGLRGVCALSVFVGHATLPVAKMDPGYAPPESLGLLNVGSAAVLVFFVLSGYFIGLTTMDPPSGRAASVYLRKRFWRLVPISTAAILGCWALSRTIPWQTVLGNLLYLQNDGLSSNSLTALLPNDPPLWSLNYEAVYYLLFLAVWFGRPRAIPAVAACLGIAVTCWLTASLPWLYRYSSGFLYWIAGLSIAWLLPKTSAPGEGNWFGAFLVGYTTWILAPLRTLGLCYGLNYLSPAPASLHRIDFLPACIWLVLALAGRRSSAVAWLPKACWMYAAAALLIELATTTMCSRFALCLCAVMLIAALLPWTRRLNTRGLALLAPMGRISYAFYVVAWPLQFWIGGMIFLPHGTALTYLLRCVLALAACLCAAWMLEIKFQRWVVSKVRRPAAS